MQKVRSRDGTLIAYDSTGSGPAAILVGGALSDRAAAGPLAALLAPRFTVYGFDRRGRGDSGDTQPYAVAREVEDISALMTAAGGSAYLFGVSSGAALALETAAAGLAVTRLALYEPPFIVDDSRPPVAADFEARLDKLLAQGRRGEAVEMFLTEAVGVPAPGVAQMRAQPMWANLERLAPTLHYDNEIMRGRLAGKPLSDLHWSAVTMPTLVLAGGDSPEWLRRSARQLAEVLPSAEYRELVGQTHAVSPPVVAPVLVEFFGG